MDFVTRFCDVFDPDTRELPFNVALSVADDGPSAIAHGHLAIGEAVVHPLGFG